MMRQRIAHVVVSADSRHAVRSDSTNGMLKNHSYVTHHVKDLEKDAVKQLLLPLFDGLSKSFFWFVVNAFGLGAEGSSEPVDPLVLEGYLLMEQRYDLLSAQDDVDRSDTPEKPVGIFGTIVSALPKVLGGGSRGGFRFCVVVFLKKTIFVF